MNNWCIEFVDVGRGKKKWTETVKQRPTEPMIERLAKKTGMLMSSSVEAIFDEDGEYGVIIVGGFREVGAFRIRQLPLSAPSLAVAEEKLREKS